MSITRRAAPEAMEIIERAIFLLRSRPAGTWAIQLAGAAPLLLMVLYFVFDSVSEGVATSRITGEAFLCAVCFLWFSICRARFAQLLTSALSDQEAGGWKRVLDPRMLLTQSCRLFAMPLAAVAIFPLGWAVTFFRSNAAFAGRNAAGRAAGMAGMWQRQTWALLLMMAVFSAVVLINILLLLVVLPMLVKIFSGAENEFTRLGVSLNWTTFAVGGGLAWLLLDPLYQAVFCVRAFLAESRETGLDLLFTLRRLAIVTIIAFITTAGAPHGRAQTSLVVSAQELNASVEKVLEQREYAWRLPHPRGARPALVDTLARVFAPVRRVAIRFGRWVSEFLRKLFSATPPETAGKPAPFPGVKWTVIVLVALLVVLAGVALLRLTRNRETVAGIAALGPVSAIELEDEAISAADLPEERWLELGRECLARGDYRLAIRALYLANLSWLGRRQLLTIAPFKSNRDYWHELRRRAPIEGLQQAFLENMRTFERSWYGRHAPDAAQVDEFEQNFARMKAYAGA